MAEHASRACLSVATEMRRLGMENWGIVGDANHSFGFHKGFPSAGDYSLSGAANRIVDSGAACAIDIAQGSVSAEVYRDWVSWMFAQYEAGNLPHVVEIIGSRDGSYVEYAATSTGRRRTRYTGSGHDSWTHVSVGRAYALFDGFGKEILGAWSPSGLTGSSSSAAYKTRYGLDSTNFLGPGGTWIGRAAVYGVRRPYNLPGFSDMRRLPANAFPLLRPGSTASMAPYLEFLFDLLTVLPGGDGAYAALEAAPANRAYFGREMADAVYAYQRTHALGTNGGAMTEATWASLLDQVKA